MTIKKPITAGLSLTLVALLTGCGMSASDGSDEPNKPVGVRTVDQVDTETKKVSSDLLRIVSVKGKVTEPGPRVNRCPPDSNTSFKMRHTWSVYDAPGELLGQAMERLHGQLPKHGWKIVSYGPDNSRAKNLELVADHDGRKFGANAVLWKSGKHGKSDPMLVVTVVSACYEVPEGQEVDRY